jgi:hypothetical protein
VYPYTFCSACFCTGIVLFRYHYRYFVKQYLFLLSSSHQNLCPSVFYTGILSFLCPAVSNTRKTNPIEIPEILSNSCAAKLSESVDTVRQHKTGAARSCIIFVACVVAAMFAKNRGQIWSRNRGWIVFVSRAGELQYSRIKVMQFRNTKKLKNCKLQKPMSDERYVQSMHAFWMSAIIMHVQWPSSRI